MGRKPRIEYYGAIYNIVCIGKDNIFASDEDKTSLMRIFADVRDGMDFKLLGFCILDDRYHLLIKNYNIPISKSMQKINMMYSGYYNSGYGNRGSIFKGRYRSRILKEYEILKELRYIHRIPVNSDKAEKSYDYKWGSDFFYMFNIDSMVDIGYVFDMLSEDRAEALIEYKRILAAPDGEAELMKGYYELDKEESSNNTELDNILKGICENEIDYQLIKSGSKKSYLMKYKLDYIMEAVSKGFRKEDIGANINMSGRAVRKYL